jgi:hypothetical protein
MSNHKKMKLLGLISFYKRLLKSNQIQKNGSASRRLKQLERKYEQRTRWLGVRYKKDKASFWLAPKDLN